MYDYAGAGGKWQRGNPTCGRVGSILSDAGTIGSETAAGFGENYGDSWGLIEGEPTPAAEAIPGEMIDGAVIDNGSITMPEPGSIMIGP
jgi:hypothetical protein